MMRRLFGLFTASLFLGLSAAATGSAKPVVVQTAALPVIAPGDLTPQWLSTQQLATVHASFPDFELSDQSGRAVERDDLDGHIVVANFFFASCSTLCPRLRSAMGKVRDAYAGAQDVRLLSHSVTPELDSPRVLDAYARANAIDGEQWRLLTGERSVLERVAHEGYLVPKTRPRDGAILHTEWLVLLDQQQRVRGIYNGTLPIEIGWLIRDIQLLRPS